MRLIINDDRESYLISISACIFTRMYGKVKTQSYLRGNKTVSRFKHFGMTVKKLNHIHE